MKITEISNSRKKLPNMFIPEISKSRKNIIFQKFNVLGKEQNFWYFNRWVEELFPLNL